MGKILSFENADIVKSELNRLTTQPVPTQTTGTTSGPVPGLGNKTTAASLMMIKNNVFSCPGHVRVKSLTF